MYLVECTSFMRGQKGVGLSHSWENKSAYSELLYSWFEYTHCSDCGDIFVKIKNQTDKRAVSLEFDWPYSESKEYTPRNRWNRIY